jgi:hypothetical protein
MNYAFSKIWIPIILIMIFTGGFFAWQYFGTLEETKDETIDWQIYKNEEYGFEIKYPKSWAYHINNYKAQQMICFYPGRYPGDCPAILSVSWGTTLQKRYTTMKEMFEKDYTVTESTISINGIEGKLLNIQNATGFSKSLFFEKNSYIYNFEIVVEHESLFSQMFSTFKFVETTKKEEPYIKIISPNGGEEWEEGKTHTIKWESSGVNKINIEYGDGKSWYIVRDYPAGSGEYPWNPQGIVSQYEGFVYPENLTEVNIKIGIWDIENSNIFDKSDASFILKKEGETTNQKTYRNEEYGFEVKYPKDWAQEVKQPSYLCQEGPGYECLASIQFSPPFPLVKTLKDIDLVIVSNQNEYSASEWIEKYTPEILSDPQTSLEKNIIIGGNNWVKLLTIISAWNQRVAFSIVKNNKLYSFGTTIGQGMEEVENTLNQMLSTFRFLE